MVVMKAKADRVNHRCALWVLLVAIGANCSGSPAKRLARPKDMTSSVWGMPVWILAKTDSFDKNRVLVGFEQVFQYACTYLPWLNAVLTSFEVMSTIWIIFS